MSGNANDMRYFRESHYWSRLCNLSKTLKDNGLTGYVRNCASRLYVSTEVQVPFLFFFRKTVSRTIGYIDLWQNYVWVEPEYQEQFRVWFPEYGMMEVMYSVNDVARAMCERMGVAYDR